MVSFRLPSRSGLVAAKAEEAEEESVSGSSSSDSFVDGVLEGPATPDGAAQPAAAALVGKKYWPQDEEVSAVLSQLDQEDREICDAAMANR